MSTSLAPHLVRLALTRDNASFRLTFAGNGDVELTMGEGPDHGLYDVYVGGSLWQSFNGYAASAGERVIPIPLSNDGTFTLQVNNRADKGSASSGHVMRFKQLSVDAEYTLQTIGYTYDAASRVLDADYYPGENTASTPVETFAYEYDVAGNLTDNNGTARTFNKLNQISSGGVTYDANGNMTNDGANAYTWDRANRLLSMDGLSYTYDGRGDRLSQTLDASPSDIVTKYLLDVQPSLVQVIAAATNSDTENYIHSLLGIHAAQDASENWRETLQDGLGSVRSEVAATLAIGVAGGYEPYGVPMDVDGTFIQPFRFTGEMFDENGLQFNRARYYRSQHATWLSLDQFEGISQISVNLNGYSWVEGNIANSVDPSGYVPSMATQLNSGLCQLQDSPQLFGVCETRCKQYFPDTLLEWIFGGMELYQSCMDTCAVIALSLSDTNWTCLTNKYLSSQNNVTLPSQTIELPTKYILFSGSYIGLITQPGPLPADQMPVWVGKFDTSDIYQYQGSKQEQASRALANGYFGERIAIVGYSSGADAAVIFADEFMRREQQTGGTGKITDLVILGGTMSGELNQGASLGNDWMCRVIALLTNGTDILAFDDAGRNTDDPEWWAFNSFPFSSPGTFTYTLDPRKHWEPGLTGPGTNNDPNLVEEIFTWILGH